MTAFLAGFDINNIHLIIGANSDDFSYENYIQSTSTSAKLKNKIQALPIHDALVINNFRVLNPFDVLDITKKQLDIMRKLFSLREKSFPNVNILPEPTN